MLRRNELVDNFAGVVELRDNVFRFEDETPGFTYHYYLRTAQDDSDDDLLVVSQDRKHLVLCLPVHRCEFSGDEPVDEFFTLRRDVVHPRIVLRFENPRTGGGTGDSEVFSGYQMLQREIDKLDGVSQGFIEISNYKGSVIEILSPADGEFRLIKNRNDAESVMVGRPLLDDELTKFLTSS